MNEVLTYEALKAKCDVLAVENAALKARTVSVPAKVYVKDMRCNVVRWAQVIDAISDAGVAFVRDDGELIAGTRETPATDAAIAAIEARGVEKAAEYTAHESSRAEFINPDVSLAFCDLADDLKKLAIELQEAK